MMFKKIENLTKRLVIIRLNSGQTLYLGPGDAANEVLETELKDNSSIARLQERSVIAVHTAENRIPGGMKEKSPDAGPIPAPVINNAEPGSKKKDKRKIKPKGGE